MPEHSRGADYLYLHANVSRRISNLETGVHPTRSESDEFDALGPTLVPITGPLLRPAQSGITDLNLRWMRRMGIVQLAGAVMVPSNKTLADMADSEVIATLVPEARPPVNLTLRGQVSGAPPASFFTYTVTTGGTVTVLKPEGVDPASSPFFHFEGSSWGAT